MNRSYHHLRSARSAGRLALPGTGRAPRGLSRRALLTTGGALGAGVLLAGCGGDSSSDGDASGSGNGSSGPWEFTDDRGETVRLDSVPRNIVAFTGSAAALYDFGIECVGVFGPTVRSNGEPDIQAGDLDVDRLTILGNDWGEFDLAEYALLEPELVVANMFDPGDMWYVPDEAEEEIFSLADGVGIAIAPSDAHPELTLTTPIERYAELAESLGADLSARKVTDAKARFEEAAESVRRAARDNPDVRVLAGSASADLMYVSDPNAYADLTFFQQLGVQFVTPDSVDETGYFQGLSWENAGRYPADVILLDTRGVALQPEDLTDRPTWNRLPAVQADQIAGWDSDPRYSYAGAAPELESLAEALSAARKVR